MNTSDLFNLKGKTAIVIGGANGIGKATALILANTPIKRLGAADDIAGEMLYFASPISEWVSGQTLFVNGGGVQTLE